MIVKPMENNVYYGHRCISLITLVYNGNPCISIQMLRKRMSNNRFHMIFYVYKRKPYVFDSGVVASPGCPEVLRGARGARTRPPAPF